MLTMQKFSKANVGGACPRCGSTSFKSKRSLAGLLAFGIFARKSRAVCQGCGRKFRRG